MAVMPMILERFKSTMATAADSAAKYHAVNRAATELTYLDDMGTFEDIASGLDLVRETAVNLHGLNSALVRQAIRVGRDQAGEASWSSCGDERGARQGNGAAPTRGEQFVQQGGTLRMSAASRPPAAPRAIVPTPFVWRDPTTIPPRQWLYGHHLIRRHVSATIAPGGAGKSTVIVTDALAMVTGRELLGLTPHGCLKVWVWNGEDPGEEIERKIAAAALRHGVDPEAIAERLFKDSGRDTPIRIDDGTGVAMPEIEALIAAIRARGIDVLSVDPYVSVHQLPENDNGAMDAAVKAFALVAERGDCAIDLVHHVRKLNGNEADLESARGAKAIADAVRAARVLNPMDERSAGEFGIDAADRREFVRIDNAKANLAPAGSARWVRIVSQPLGNATPERPGDLIGVAIAWTPPELWADVTTASINAVLTAIDAGLPNGQRYSDVPAAKSRAAWVVVQSYCPGKSERQCRQMVRTWARTGLLYRDTYHDPIDRKDRIGLRVDASKRPPA